MYKQGTTYLAMLLMSSYESSFSFQKTLLAHTNTDQTKKADLHAVEMYVMESIVGAQAGSPEGVVRTIMGPQLYEITNEKSQRKRHCAV